MSTKGKSVKPEDQNHVDPFPEDHSPVEEIPMEQTRVYQNQPSDQTRSHAAPKTPSGSAVLQKTRLNKNVKKKLGQNRMKVSDIDQNAVDENQRLATHQPFTNAGFEGNSAIWVTERTEQPGFLFPVSRTVSPPAVHRKVTEEASLSEEPHQVLDFSSVCLQLGLN